MNGYKSCIGCGKQCTPENAVNRIMCRSCHQKGESGMTARQILDDGEREQLGGKTLAETWEGLRRDGKESSSQETPFTKEPECGSDRTPESEGPGDAGDR